MLGPNTRANLSCLRVRHGLRDPDPTPAGHTAFQKLLPALRTCTKLCHLELGLCVSDIFRNGLDALSDYFILWQPLSNPGLEALASTIQCLPRLTSVELHFQSYFELYHELDHDTESFLQFVFSGFRETAPWKGIKERLQATWNTFDKGNRNRKLNSKTTVIISRRALGKQTGDQVMHFRNWLKLYTEYAGGLDGHCR
jgi:hypothetical protein